jgi:hypothetical protein
MAKFSNGLRNAMLDSVSLRTKLSGAKMKIYSGPVPATADDSIGGASLLCTISNDATATGLTFAASASDGTITKTVAEIWRGVNAASGTASFYRIEEAADTGALSTTLARIQGTIAVAGADLNLSSVTLTAAASQTIDNYVVALPTL